MHVSPVKALGSEKTLWLAHDWPHYPGSRVHPLTLHSNPPPAWPLLSCLLLKTHLSQLLPLDNNQGPGICQGSKNDCSSCLKIYCFFRCCYCLFRQSNIMVKVHSSCGLETWQCLGSDVWGTASMWLSGHSLSYSRESGCTPRAPHRHGWPQELLDGSSTPRSLFQTQALKWQPLLSHHATYSQTSPTYQNICLEEHLSFELSEYKVDSSSSREGASWSLYPYKAQTGRNATF